MVIDPRGFEQIAKVGSGGVGDRRVAEEAAEENPAGKHRTDGSRKRVPAQAKAAGRMGRDSNPGCLAANTLSRRAH